jgi:flagellar secretion chaperone FliS
MTMRAHRTYAATQRETSVSSAKPVELVAMVYQRLLDHLQTGKVQMAEGSDSSESLTKAIDLITTGLESCLDKEKGGEIAQNLAFIYDWAGKEIIRARLRRDPEMIQGVINAFVPLAEAWLEHAGQKDESFASKYLQPVVATAKSLSSKAVGTSASGINGMNAAFAASA